MHYCYHSVVERHRPVDFCLVWLLITMLRCCLTDQMKNGADREPTCQMTARACLLDCIVFSYVLQYWISFSDQLKQASSSEPPFLVGDNLKFKNRWSTNDKVEYMHVPRAEWMGICSVQQPLHSSLPGLFGDNKNVPWLMVQTILSWDNVHGL